MSRKKWGYIYILPTLVLLTAVAIYPFLYNLRLSFYKWDLLKTQVPKTFVGIYNYEAVTADPYFHNSLKVTGLFVFGSVCTEVLFGLLLALLLYKETRFHRVIRKILIFPFVIAPALVGYAWRFFLNPEFGIIDYIVKLFLPIESGLFWAADRQWALVTLIAVDAWQWTPFVSLIFMAGLSSIPQETIDASKVDGATSLQIFRYITFPLLIPTLSIALIIKTIYSLKEFDKMLLLTKGGPGRVTEVIAYYIFKVGLVSFDMGKAAAVSFLLAIIMTVIITVYLKVLLPRSSQ
jgi:multiple sugar transport system permease protein